MQMHRRYIMDEKEFKEQLLLAGASEEQIAKVDFEKMESIFDKANSIEDLCKVLKENYSDFNEAEFKKAIVENEKADGEALDLSDADLESVAGGSVGSWLNKNKAWLIPVAAFAAAGIGYGVYKYKQNKLMAEAEKLYPENKGEITKKVYIYLHIILIDLKNFNIYIIQTSCYIYFLINFWK